MLSLLSLPAPSTRSTLPGPLQVREHFHGEGMGLSRSMLARTSKRAARLLDLHFSGTRVLKKVFFALKAQVVERRTALLAGGDASWDGSVR